MNDTKLNEQIARLLEWKQVLSGRWRHPVHGDHGTPLNYLDDSRLSELLRLAATLGRWELCIEPQGDFFAQIELPSDDDDDDPYVTGKGVTPPLAIARAIAAHKESTDQKGANENGKV